MDELVQFATPTSEAQTRVETVRVLQDGISKQKLAKRAHDIVSSLRSLTFAVEALEKGYRFDDATAPAKVASMRRAVETLEKESAVLRRILLGKEG